MAEEIFDFGFTLVDEDELDTVQEIEQKVSETSSTVEATQEKLDKLFGAIQPLLNNLSFDLKHSASFFQLKLLQQLAQNLRLDLQ